MNIREEEKNGDVCLFIYLFRFIQLHKSVEHNVKQSSA
jgi:hypothetical protein